MCLRKAKEASMTDQLIRCLTAGDVVTGVTFIHRLPAKGQPGLLTEHGIYMQVQVLLLASRVTFTKLNKVIRLGSPGTRL